jgi:hypothetical protein
LLINLKLIAAKDKPETINIKPSNELKSAAIGKEK